jgi:ABC-2 type transport system ATP-binding protein
MITAKGICKRFGHNVVLDAFDFSPTRGRVTVLLGRNGSGKSTFLKLCLGALKADAGELVAPPRSNIGYVPDKPDCYEWMTPRDLFRFLRPQYPTWNEDEVTRLCETLDVPVQTKFKALSRGEGMKAMLVAALAPNPEFLLLDEPFAGLDVIARDEVLRGVINALRDGERTVLCTTHDLDVASRIADEVALLGDGKIQSITQTGAAPSEMRDLLAEVSA